jgi:valyl-tRNA synthetase
MAEENWQTKWEEWQLYKFNFNSKKPIYSIDVPPRYADGVLHVGHATHYIKLDFIARYKRMQGNEVFFPLCVDVNGMPIELSVEKRYKVSRKNTSKEKLIELCTEFANKNIEVIKKQFRSLGISLDESLFYRTDSPSYRRITQFSFLKMLEEGLVYKKEHPVLWCPSCSTALASADVEYYPRKAELYWIKFKLAEETKSVEVATTRPELLGVCQAIGVNPNDHSKKWLIGKHLLTPIFNKRVKVLADKKVDPSFGSGVVMICSIGDKEDLEWIYKYKLPLEQAIDKEGKLTRLAGKFAGMEIEKGRKAILEDLLVQGLIKKVEEIEQSVGLCWRCKTPVEFLQIPQWFLKTLDFKKDILKISNQIRWWPKHMEIRLRNWVNSLAWDWVISRQRYFATPIPLWECERCGKIVPATPEMGYVDPTKDKPLLENCPLCGGKLKGCEDVFDTWMDSSLSALFNCYWLRDEGKFERLYPMSLRPQSHDIIRNWAMYTILRSFLLTHKKPWNNLLVDGFILAPDGRPMHASWGNVVDPLPIVEEYGADAFRYWASKCAIGQDLPFQLKEVVHGRKLRRKLESIQRFIWLNLDSKPKKPRELRAVDKWIINCYNQTLEKATQAMEKFDFPKALDQIESFTWHELADHYLEMVKWKLKEKKDLSACWTLYQIGLGLTKLLAPFFCYLTEEIYQSYYKTYEKSKSIHLTQWPRPIKIGEIDSFSGEIAKEIIREIRNWKNKKRLALNAQLERVEIMAGEKAKQISLVSEDIARTLRIKELIISKERKGIKEEIRSVKPLAARIGTQFREKAKEIIRLIKATNPQIIASKIEKDKRWQVALKDGSEIELTQAHLKFEKSFSIHGRKCDLIKVKDILIAIVA